MLGKKRGVNLYLHQKLQYTGAVNAAQGIYGEYLICPTQADGDCFIHAAFTENGDTKAMMTKKAADIREDLCKEIQAGNYIDDCRKLLYEHYVGEHGNGNKSEVPENIRKMFEHNDHCENVRSSLHAMGVAFPDDLIIRHPEGDMVAAISDDSVKIYMESLRECAGEDSFIPVRGDDVRCPGSIIAERKGKRINIFTYKRDVSSLHLVKSVGPADGATPVNILIDGNHFVRLYNPGENVAHRLQSEQIIKNS